MRTITIGARTQYVTFVSDEDYDYLMQWPWTYAVSHRGGQLIYARRSIRVAGQNITILMHRVILDRMGSIRPSDKHTTDHDNGNSLDNQRPNLFWRTPKEQMTNRHGFQNWPIGRTPKVKGGINLADVPF